MLGVDKNMNKRLVFFLLCVLLIALCLPVHGEEAAPAPAPVFDVESGFYLEPFTLHITFSDPACQIHYTLDGSVPDATDPVWPGELFMDRSTQKEDPLSQIGGTSLDTDAYTLPDMDFPSAHVVRAVAVYPDGNLSAVTSATYFVGYYRSRLYGDLPVISLIVEPDALFDYDTGIYMLGKTFQEWQSQQEESFEAWQAVGNFSNRGREWERLVTVDFLMSETEHFQQEMGVRIKGGTSRTAPQKSLRLIAREEYGQKNVKYDLFPGNVKESDGTPVEKYKSVTLRNGGNDRGGALIRDPFITKLSEGMRFETADNRPVMAFINGEYWGIYTLHEEYSDNYIGYHYDMDNKNVITMKNGEVEDGEDEDLALYEEMYDLIAYGDMTDEDEYEAACQLLDMGSYADYIALTLYICNDDSIFDGNNWQLWRVREPESEDGPADGKWRVMLFDSDHAAGVYQSGANYMERNIENRLFEEFEDGHPARLAQSLIYSDAFLEELVLSMCDVRNLYFEKQRLASLFLDMSSKYTPYAPDTFRRFGPMWGPFWDPKGAFGNNLQSIPTFFNGRYDGFLSIVQEAFALEDPVTVTLVCEGDGQILINGRTVPITDSLTVQYFPEYPITLSAVTDSGFAGWQVTEGEASLSHDKAAHIAVTLTEDCTITAVFE